MCEFCSSHNDPLHWSNEELEEQIKLIEKTITARELEISELRNTIKTYKNLIRENLDYFGIK